MIKSYCANLLNAWDRFWFNQADCFVLCVMRILVGIMLVYTHCVWSKELMTFFADSGVLARDYTQALHGNSWFAWSHFYWFQSPTMLWVVHAFAIVIFAMFTLGIFTRATGILSFLLVVSYANRAAGALFGLDQMNAYLTMYLAIAPCGHALSVDAWMRTKRGLAPLPQVTTWANVAIRLLQCHLCVIYFFAGTGKLLGPAWWGGEAIWMSFASYEYQSIDMTWMVHYPLVMNAITLSTLLWEVSYAYLVWPKMTRPIMVGMAILVHAGIGLTMGMITFGYIMIVANVAFISSALLRKVLRQPVQPPTSP
ncbi:MAG TPA: HTTM domain-containing protein [Pirellulaceae bacterium]|nr:HTTM domain-containing protein [Pirellulaceae bacterium]HMO90799.1 HTTM domain-containing protein [Pirellulaceae bacterium]HMP68050.1 HTTM domain-containing protein [Pirellulaceae bacterium]